MEEHYYNAKHSALEALGLEPHLLTDEVIGQMSEFAEGHRDRIDPDVISPDIKWKQN